jgi:hypothetical protein
VEPPLEPAVEAAVEPAEEPAVEDLFSLFSSPSGDSQCGASYGKRFPVGASCGAASWFLKKFWRLSFTFLANILTGTWHDYSNYMILHEM